MLIEITFFLRDWLNRLNFCFFVLAGILKGYLGLLPVQPLFKKFWTFCDS